MMRRFRAKCQFQMSVLSVNVSSMSPGTDMRKLLSRLTNRVFLKKCQKCQVICSIDILSFFQKENTLHDNYFCAQLCSIPHILPDKTDICPLNLRYWPKNKALGCQFRLFKTDKCQFRTDISDINRLFERNCNVIECVEVHPPEKLGWCLFFSQR